MTSNMEDSGPTETVGDQRQSPRGETATASATGESGELVVGLVAPAGTEKGKVRRILEVVLDEYDYTLEHHRLSDFFGDEQVQRIADEKLETGTEYERVLTSMNVGDGLRWNTRRKDAMGLVAAGLIGVHRSGLQQEGSSGAGRHLDRTAHLVDSLKRPEEAVYLSKVYGARFILVSVYTPRDERIRNLKHRGMGEDEAVRLVLRDETGHGAVDPEERQKFGQATGKTFQMADLFVDSTQSDDELRREFHRFFDLVFGCPLITPKVDEHAMFLAFAASLRSGDLSRQVGTVIATADGAVVAEGANDAPGAFGRLYWPDEADQRDIARGYDSNERIRHRMTKAASAGLSRRGAIELEEGEVIAALREAGFLDITEFGRAVHAEMAALMSCAKRGVSASEHTLYCTTFPCHNCTKHIAAAGIRKVLFIEPYPKSRAVELHSDAISMSGEEGKVEFRAFVGIGPKRYAQLFALRDLFGASVDRKGQDGEVVRWQRKGATALLPDQLVTYLDREDRALDLLVQVLDVDVEREAKQSKKA